MQGGQVPDATASEGARDTITGQGRTILSVVSAIGRRLGVLPRGLTALGCLTALTLLFVSGNVPWSELVLPAWSLVLSGYVLLAGAGYPEGFPDGRSRPAGLMLANGT